MKYNEENMDVDSKKHCLFTRIPTTVNRRIEIIKNHVCKEKSDNKSEVQTQRVFIPFSFVNNLVQMPLVGVMQNKHIGRSPLWGCRGQGRHHCRKAGLMAARHMSGTPNKIRRVFLQGNSSHS